MPTWKTPPIIKLYEALGAIADKRIQVNGNTAKVYSSSGNKFYQVIFDENTDAIMCNDNGSYWQGYLGYPAICFLLATNKLPYSAKVSENLKDIMWKDLNTKNNNNWDKTLDDVKTIVAKRGGNIEELEQELNRLYAILKSRTYNHLGKKVKPPSGY